MKNFNIRFNIRLLAIIFMMALIVAIAISPNAYSETKAEVREVIAAQKLVNADERREMSERHKQEKEQLKNLHREEREELSANHRQIMEQLDSALKNADRTPRKSKQ